MSRIINYMLLAAFACLFFVFAMKIYRDGLEHGMSLKKPAVIVIKPPCIDKPEKEDQEDSILWRI